jgi:hypothetical protein
MESGERRPSVGDIVHFVLEEGPHAGEHRPALIVKVWGATPGSACQLQVFTDSDGGGLSNDQLPPVLLKTSRSQGAGPGTWHWPEAAEPVEAAAGPS